MFPRDKQPSLLRWALIRWKKVLLNLPLAVLAVLILGGVIYYHRCDQIGLLFANWATFWKLIVIFFCRDEVAKEMVTFWATFS
jgi:hypothetical protein